MSSPFDFSCNITSGDDTLLALSGAGSFAELSTHQLNLEGAGTHAVGLGSIAELKVILLSVSVGTVEVLRDGESLGSFSAGGGFGHFYVTPVAVGSVSLVYTDDATVTITLLG